MSSPFYRVWISTDCDRRATSGWRCPLFTDDSQRRLQKEFLCQGFPQRTADTDDDQRDTEQCKSDQRINGPKIKGNDIKRVGQENFDKNDIDSA